LKSLAIVGMLAIQGGAAVAQTTVEKCKPEFRTVAASVAEPWEENTRTFAKGAIRLVVMDTIEPAVAAYHLLVLAPPYSEVGDRSCRLVSFATQGFGGINLVAANATYDPAKGLGVRVPVRLYNGETADFDQSTLFITINQATGAVVAGLLD
jgi:hypothetical protein